MLASFVVSLSPHFYSATFSAYVLCKALNGVCSAGKLGGTCNLCVAKWLIISSTHSPENNALLQL